MTKARERGADRGEHDGDGLGGGNTAEINCPLLVDPCDKGRYLYDVQKIFGFLDPFPPCPQLVQIYSTEFTLS